MDTEHNMTPKKIITALVLILVVAGGAVAGLTLLRERQEIGEQAAVPNGQAEASIFPSSGTFEVGNSFPVSVYFNTANIAVNGVAIRLKYPYSGVSPEVTASGIAINPSLLSSGDWSCPVQDVTQESGNVNIDIACANLSATGFASNTDTLLATLNLTVASVPAVSPLVVTFDPTESVVTDKLSGQDILLIPQSEGAYAVNGAAAPTATPDPSATATPTTAAGITVTPTTTATTVTPTTALTATPTTTAAVATVTPTLPEAGVSIPTVLAISLGLFAIIGSLILAF